MRLYVHHRGVGIVIVADVGIRQVVGIIVFPFVEQLQLRTAVIVAEGHLGPQSLGDFVTGCGIGHHTGGTIVTSETCHGHRGTETGVVGDVIRVAVFVEQRGVGGCVYIRESRTVDVGVHFESAHTEAGIHQESSVFRLMLYVGGAVIAIILVIADRCCRRGVVGTGQHECGALATARHANLTACVVRRVTIDFLLPVVVLMLVEKEKVGIVGGAERTDGGAVFDGSNQFIVRIHVFQSRESTGLDVGIQGLSANV